MSKVWVTNRCLAGRKGGWAVAQSPILNTTKRCHAWEENGKNLCFLFTSKRNLQPSELGLSVKKWRAGMQGGYETRTYGMVLRQAQ